MKLVLVSILISNLLLSPIASSSDSLQPQPQQEFQSILKIHHELKLKIDTLKEKVDKLVLLREDQQQEDLYEVIPREEVTLIEIFPEEKPPEEKTVSNKEADYLTTLKKMGYYKKETDNEVVNNRNAVLRFQSDHNLIVDGVFGEKSATTLKKRVEDSHFKHKDSITQVPTKDKWIVVNKTKRILTLYQGNQVIKKYPIAQGKTPALTPEGKFTIVNKVINPAWGGAGISAPIKGGSPQNPLGYRWLGLSHGGGSRYGIHGNNNPLSIGTNASMGCVRMINSDVEELFNLISVKTIVWIGTETQLEEWGLKQTSYIDAN